MEITREDILNELKSREQQQGVSQAIPMQQEQQQKTPVQNNSFLNKLAYNPAMDAVLGAGDAARRALSLGYITDQSVPQQEQGMAYKAGGLGGNLMAYAMGGAPLKAIGAGIGLAPALETGLGAAASRIGGGAAFGAAVNPENRFGGAAEGAALGGAFEAIPAAGRLIKSGVEKFTPKKAVESLSKILDNKAVDLIKEKGGALYNNIIDRVGGRNIYNRESGKLALPGQEETVQKYIHLNPDEIKTAYNSDLKKLHNRFMDYPTLENAKDLKSQLGSELRDLSSMKLKQGGLTAIDRTNQASYKAAHDLLSNDIHGFLSSVNPALSEAYKAADLNWATNVEPYKASSNILRKLGNNPDPKKIVSAFEKASINGKQIPKEVQEHIGLIGKKISQKNEIQRAASMLLGASMGNLVGGGEAVGALAGGMFGVPIVNALGKSVSGGGGLIGSVMGGAYPQLSKAMMLQILSNQQK